MKVASKPGFNAAIAEGIPCPMIATLTNEGKFQISPDGKVDFDNLRAALKAVGIGFVAREILVRGTKAVETERLQKAGQLLAGMEVTSVDLTKLRDTSLMHSGDSKIRRDGFKQERLDWLFTFSSDGQGLTIKDIARAQLDEVQRDAGTRGRVIGWAELGALIQAFGTKNAQGEKALAKDALLSLFRDTKLPEGKPPKPFGMPTVLANMAKIAFNQLLSPAGRAAASIDNALGRQSPLDQSGVSGLGKAICPAGMRPQNPALTATDAAGMHQQG